MQIMVKKEDWQQQLVACWKEKADRTKDGSSMMTFLRQVCTNYGKILFETWINNDERSLSRRSDFQLSNCFGAWELISININRPNFNELCNVVQCLKHPLCACVDLPLIIAMQGTSSWEVSRLKWKECAIFSSNTCSTALLFSKKISNVKHSWCSWGCCTAVLNGTKLAASVYAPDSGKSSEEYEVFIKEFRTVLYAGRRQGASSTLQGIAIQTWDRTARTKRRSWITPVGRTFGVVLIKILVASRRPCGLGLSLKKKRKSQLDYILSPRTSYATVNNYNKEKFWSTGGHYPENADSARVWKDKTEKVKDESWLGGNQSAIGRSNR